MRVNKRSIKRKRHGSSNTCIWSSLLYTGSLTTARFEELEYNNEAKFPYIDLLITAHVAYKEVNKVILHVECGFFYCYVYVYVSLAIEKNPEHVETFYILQVEKDKQKM